MHQLCFCTAGGSDSWLAPATLNDDFFWDLVSHKGGAYLSLHGVAETENMNADFFVDLALLHEMLDLLDNDAT